MLATGCGVVLIASLILGGGTRGGFLSDVILQLIAIPLFLVSLSELQRSNAGIRLRNALRFCAALVLIPILQLLPLPPLLWTWLPGQEIIAEAFTLLQQELAWRPISVAPHATWLGLLSLIVPLAVFLAAVQLRRRERQLLSLTLLGIGVISLFLGLLQVSQGPSSPLRFFAFTNPTEAVGFFANRNHFSALLYSLMLIAAAWTVHVGALLSQTDGRKGYDTPLIVALLAGLALMVSLIGAQMMARSRAGLGLAILALIAVWALAVRDRPKGTGTASSRLLAGAVGLAVVLGMQFALYRVIDRFGIDPLVDARIPFAKNTITAAMDFMPFGSGVGTFVPVYSMFEPVHDMLTFYANRAHNDVLELWLEAGIAALLLMAVFLTWLIKRSIMLWRMAPPHGSDIDLLLARSAGVVLVLVSLHSLVDYPLRTAAMMALFAFAAALMFDPPDAPDATRNTSPRSRAKKDVARGRIVRPATSHVAASPQALRQDNSWPDVEWPEEWRAEPGHDTAGESSGSSEARKSRKSRN